MMKKMIALATVFAFVFVLPTLAVASGTKKSTPHVSGTITSWDDMAKQATVKDSAGKEISFGWNDKTKVTGMPKVGEHASVSYTKDKDGKRWATHISVGAKPASTKTPAPKYGTRSGHS
jgi:hypothetical protein